MSALFDALTTDNESCTMKKKRKVSKQMSVNNPEDMNEVEFDTMTLSLDDGTELECAVLAIFPVQEKKYIALSPMSGEDEGTVYLYHFASDENDEEVTLLNIEDDDEFDAVSDAFDELLDEEEFADVFEEEDEE